MRYRLIQTPLPDDELPLVARITEIFADSRQNYGSPRITAAVRQRGLVVYRKRVARSRRCCHLVARYRRHRRVKTTDSRHGLPVAPNRLNRDFSAQRPNEKWVADFTYIDTAEGWLYLALVLDVFSRKIVGWAMENHMETRWSSRLCAWHWCSHTPLWANCCITPTAAGNRPA